MVRRRFALSALPVLCVIPLLLAGCGDKTPSDPRADIPLVREAAVQGAAPGLRTFTGTVSARIQSDLSFRVSGKVLERRVDTGQTVRRGQILMRIDPVDLTLAATSQQEAVAAARARAQQTADEEARYRDLRGTGAISASAYDQVKAAADAASAQLNAAQAQFEVARNATGYSDLLADADGIIMETLVEPGQVVSPGQAVLRLAQSGRREAVIQLPETLRPTAGSTGQATLYGNDAVSAPAKLRQLSDAADPLTRTFEARYVMEGAMANAPLGTTVSIRVPDGMPAASGEWRVPMGALFDAGKGPGVWVIGGEPTKVSWRPVDIRGMADDNARIAGQFAQDEKIVGLGAHLLREGQQVRVARPATAVSTTATTKAAGSRP